MKGLELCFKRNNYLCANAQKMVIHEDSITAKSARKTERCVSFKDIALKKAESHGRVIPTPLHFSQEQH